jgi:1-acylglycerone phosphate reductase
MPWCWCYQFPAFCNSNFRRRVGLCCVACFYLAACTFAPTSTESYRTFLLNHRCSVTVTSILRTTSVSNSLEKKADITYNFIDRGIWTLTEANLGIISACLLVLKQPLGRLFPRLFGSTKKASLYYPDNSLGRNAGYNLSDLQGTNAVSSGLWQKQARLKNKTSISGQEQSRQESDEDDIAEEYKVGNSSRQDILAGHRENR